MNTEALFFIVLAFWVFVLQSKIKHLKKLVRGLMLHKDNKPMERIIFFIVVGTLLLLIGYFMPLSPNQEKIDNQKEKED